MTEAASVQPIEYRIDASASALLIEARSTAGRISFGTNSIAGFMRVAGHGGALLMSPVPQARLVVDMSSLRSGNALYDAELAQRLEVRRYPEAAVELSDVRAVGGRYQLGGTVNLHGQTRMLDGSVQAERRSGGWLITGEQVFDIREFEIPVPSLLMLRIFPDVRVHMSLFLRPPDPGPQGHRLEV